MTQDDNALFERIEQDLRGRRDPKWAHNFDPALTDDYEALLALARAQPEGWVLVPREPTEAMVHEGGLMCDDGTEHEERARARGVWIMMVEASPLCPAAPTSDGGEG